MKLQLTIEGFKTKYGFESSLYRGDINNGEQLKQYLQKFYKFSNNQAKKLSYNHFEVKPIN